MQMLTEMVMQMMGSSAEAHIPTQQRNIPGLAVFKMDDSDDDESYFQHSSIAPTGGETTRKRRNTRTSPRKTQVMSGRIFHSARPPDTQPPVPEATTGTTQSVNPSFFDRDQSTPSPALYPQDPPSPLYPDHPDHPLHECHPELSLDLSGLVAADANQSPPRALHFESRPVELNDTDMSDDFLHDIQEQHSTQVQPISTPSAELHAELEIAAILPTQRPESPPNSIRRNDERGTIITQR
ncbi:hypothetical protein MHU86_20393 [Fragilaria crotonensis]|nr:hypothetical protein MHU86_20393 [Fragilaria crotonensis]